MRHARLASVPALLVAAFCAACDAPGGQPGGDGVLPAEADRVEARPEQLQDRVQAHLASLDAVTALYAKHLPSGREVAIRADRPMNTLSVIKIPIMVQAYRDAAEGRLDLDERHTVRPEEIRRGSGLIQTFAPGLRPTVRDLVTQMIITSDNTATDLMIERVGLSRVNETLRALGYRETALRMTTGDLFREVWVRADPVHAGLTHREVYERGFPSDAGAAGRSFSLEGDSSAWLGRTTAREMGRLLEQLHEGELADDEATSEMIGILGRQFYTTRLPRRVRFQGVTVAHKTGDWPPIAGNDVGILYYDGGPTIVSVFTNQNRGDFFVLEETLGTITEEIVRAWR